MSGNRHGRLFSFTTFGESHGIAIGCVIDGVPPMIPLDESYIQKRLDLRKPGTSKHVTARNESDTVQILSGVFEGKTTGTPICLLIKNTDQHSQDYSNIANKFRPGHADYTYQAKYGIRDYRGGGRSSARETAMRVAAGAVAQAVLDFVIGHPVNIIGAVIEMGGIAIDKKRWNDAEIRNNPFFCPDAQTALAWDNMLDSVRKQGSSVGAIIEVTATGIPVGLGCPVYDKIDAELAKAIMSINAIKGVEIGDGFAAARLRGEENADEIYPDDTTPSGVRFSSNHAGGVLGGITTGQPLIVRAAIKPTSSILIERNTVDTNLDATTIATHGRHDPCVGIRAVPVVEAMVACVLADALLLHRAQCGF